MTRQNLAEYRMERAKEILVEAKDSLEQSHFGLAVNRSYYAMFTSARALLALEEVDSSKHSGVISLFNQHLVKSGLFPAGFSKFLREAKNIREDADYGDFVRITRTDAETQIDRAKEFVAEAERALARIIESPGG